MSEKFDPYYTWLAIPPEEQPPHHYRLLGVKPLEENPDVIENAADQRMLHLRTYASGKQGENSQKLLNEVAAAKVLLLDAAKKKAYDAELRAKLNAAKQAELKKAREERPLATAKPLPTAAPLEAKPAPATAGAKPQFSAPAPSGAARKLNNVVLLIAVGVVALVLLAGGGVAAMMMLAGDQRVADGSSTPESVTQNNVTDVRDNESDSEGTGNLAPVVPPVVPATSHEDQPADPTTETDDEIVDETAEEVVDETPVSDPIEAVDLAGEEPVAVEDVDPASDEPQKLPVPDKAEREAKQKQILTIFAVAKAKTFDENGELAALLIETAGETVDDPAAVFALLNLARETAAEAGQIKLALEATDMLGETFEFDAAAVRIASLQQAARAGAPPAAKREIVIAGMNVIDELSAADKFTDADAVSDRMLSIARPLRDPELIKSLADQRKAFTELAASFEKAQSAFETLKTSPDDAAANLAAGRYLTFVKQDWDTGLAHLAKGSDAALATAAKAELAAPTTPADQEKLADAWWAAAEGQKEAAVKDACRAQSAYWYREIVADLSGLAKVKVEKRIQEVGDIGLDRFSARPGGRRELEVVYLDDLSEGDVRHGHHPLRKHGQTFADGQPGTFNGEVPKHSLSIHAVANGSVGMSYELDGTFETFEGVAAQWDDGVGGRSGSPLTFTITCDDKLVWTSKPIHVHGTGEPFKVSIKGVRKLTLRSDCPGSSEAGWGVWIYPRISRYQTGLASDEPDLGIFSRDPAELDAPSAEEFVYLDDLTEMASEIGYGSLGKHGADGARGKVIFGGELQTHSLSVHAKEADAAYVTYRLGKKYDTFQATAGLRESAGGQRGESVSPLTFSVIGDKKVLWKSRAIKQHGDGEPCSVSVRGVDVLTLQVDSPGPAGQGWSIWVEPRLTQSIIGNRPTAKPQIPKSAVKFGEHYYVVSTDQLDSPRALAKCQEAGGYLARIESPEEQQFIEELLKATDRVTRYVWIDGSDASAEGDWQFSDGKRVSWTNWEVGWPDPDNGSIVEDSVAINTQSSTPYRWMDIAASSAMSYVCEWDDPRTFVADTSHNGQKVRPPKGKKPNPKAFYNCVIGGYMNYHESKPVYPLLNLQVPQNNLWNDKYAAQLQNMVRGSLAYRGQARFFAPQDGDYDVQAANIGIEIDGVKLAGFRDAYTERVTLRKGLHIIVLGSHTHGQPHLQNASVKIIDAKTGDELPLVNLWADVQAALATPVGGVRVTEISGWQPDEEKIVPIKLK